MQPKRRLQIVLLSGRIGSGKTQLAAALVDRYGATLIKTRELITQELPKTKPERLALQRAGERLDRETKGAWVGNALVRRIEEIGSSAGLPTGLYVMDAVRIVGQLDAIREAKAACLGRARHAARQVVAVADV